MTEDVEKDIPVLEIEKILELRRLVDVLYDIQDVRIRTANRLRQMPKATRQVYVGPLLSVEANLTSRVEGLLAYFPIYTEFLYNVRGVGPRISGCIIANTMIRFEKVEKDDFADLLEKVNSEEFDDLEYSVRQIELAQKTERGGYLIPVIRGIGAFATVSKFWWWWGLGVKIGRAHV